MNEISRCQSICEFSRRDLQDLQVWNNITRLRLVVGVLAGEFGHFHLDDARVETRSAWSVNPTIGDQGQQMPPLTCALVRGCRGQDGGGVQNVLEGVQEADHPWVLIVLLGGLADERADGVVGNRQGVYFLFDQVRQLAAKGSGRLSPQGGALMGFDFIPSLLSGQAPAISMSQR